MKQLKIKNSHKKEKHRKTVRNINKGYPHNPNKVWY